MKRIGIIVGLFILAIVLVILFKPDDTGVNGKLKVNRLYYLK